MMHGGTKSKSGGESRFVLRLPTALYEELKADAGQSRRSINSQLVVVIEKHLKEAA